MRVYISGPMTGLPDFNAPAFHAAAAKMRLAGLWVVNPAEQKQEEGKPWAEYIRTCLRWLVDCDAIAMLPGWQGSKGACLELAVAVHLGLMVFDVVTGDRLDGEVMVKAELRKLGEQEPVECEEAAGVGDS